MTGTLTLQDTHPAQHAWMTVQVFGHNDEAIQNIWLLAQDIVNKHAGTITAEQPLWVARFDSTDCSLSAAIAMQQTIDTLNFDNGLNPPLLWGIHIAHAEKNSLPPDVFLRPGEIHLSESAYQACQQDHTIKFRTAKHAHVMAYKAIWKAEEFELASATPHQQPPSLGFFVKLILILLTPFVLVLAYTMREPLQQSFRPMDDTRSIDHRLH